MISQPFNARSANASLNLWVDFSRLDVPSQGRWWALIRLIQDVLRREVSLNEFVGAPPDDGSAFAFLTDSVVLSRKLLMMQGAIYIQPSRAPQFVDPWLFFFSLGSSSNTHAARFEITSRSVTLISSVFKGDVYLDGFLENSAALHGYANCEHLLIRAGSPGAEHDRLVDHVRRCPNAVYLNLSSDPGLYEVWNLGARLATGRYLSNANIDDRRAPEHLEHLIAVLNQYPDTDVASTRLRVSLEKNLAWENSGGCTLWPIGVETQEYRGEGLLQIRHGRVVSRNLPHCMPLWRRGVHGFVGEFDERSYGPSADWAFWLKTASLGGQFHFSSEALGLYLKDQSSYWRRNSVDGLESSFDAAIIAQFVSPTGESEQLASTLRQPFSIEIATVIRRLEEGACLDGLAYFLEVVFQHASSLTETGRALIGSVSRRYFGGCLFRLLIESAHANDPLVRQKMLFNTLVDLVHAVNPEGDLIIASARITQVLSFACIDWFEMHDDWRGLALLALLSRKVGDSARENRILQWLHDSDPRSFWSGIQDVYRFSRPLRELCSELSGTACHVLPETDSRKFVSFFPNYTGNAYLNLLYQSLIDQGNTVSAVSEVSDFLSIVPAPGGENILHVHWVNALTRSRPQGSDVSLNQHLMDDFIDGLRSQKKKGFKVYWTIHNYLSHECFDPKAEIAFRQALYALADRVFIHHPLAAYLLDWLPDYEKLCLCEHGPYDAGHVLENARAAARSALGFGSDDFLVTHVGRVRDYKGLKELLPVVRDLLDDLPQLRFVIAGKIASKAVETWLSENPHPRLIVHDAHIDDDALERYMVASDVGVLAYDAILTSGTLFHWLSVGRPILAPVKGTIPCYVVDGWNGYGYKDVKGVKNLITHFSNMPEVELNRFSENAYAMSRQLAWRFLN